MSHGLDIIFPCKYFKATVRTEDKRSNGSMGGGLEGNERQNSSGRSVSCMLGHLGANSLYFFSLFSVGH